MVFELSSGLLDSILFSMEDQTAVYAVDAKSGVLVQAEGDTGIQIDEDLYYTLPSWNSGDGYDLLEDFANSVYAPLVRQELKKVLVSGRGVFRNYKNVLKQYPELDRKWHLFKHKRMTDRIYDWYNGLRESWGLEALEDFVSDAASETDELLSDDFEFCEYDSIKDRNDIVYGRSEITEEFTEQFAVEDESLQAGKAAAFLVLQQSSFSKDEDKKGFVCRSHSGDFTGCILYDFCSSSSDKTVALTDLFVLQNYRGLGIGKELISLCLASLKENGIQWVIISNHLIPENLAPCLTQLGFEKKGAFFTRYFGN